MANKKQFISDYSAQRIGELIESVLNQGESSKWEKPWISSVSSHWICRNIDRPAPYQGVNAGLLSLAVSVNNYRTPLFLTLEKAREMGLSIKINSDGKREQSWPVFKWIQLIFDKQGTKISYDEYQELDEEEKEKCRTHYILRTYFVYNLDQTTIQQDLPKTWEKFVSLYPDMSEQMQPDKDAEDKALDYILSTKGAWRCPITHEVGDQACYSYSADYKIEKIILPKREQFKTVSGYYGTALHEMAHSTKGESSMRRDYGRKKWGDEGYALEELVAEFVAAFVCCDRGHTKTIDKEHISYVQSWRNHIKKRDVVSTIVDDLMRAVNYEMRCLRQVDLMLASQEVSEVA